LGNQSDIEERLTNSGLGILHQLVSRWIYALHTGNEDEVTCSTADTPSTLRLDGTARIEGFDTVG
jgi:hypothetical protein